MLSSQEPKPCDSSNDTTGVPQRQEPGADGICNAPDRKQTERKGEEMPNDSGSPGDVAKETFESVRDDFSTRAGEVKSKVSDMARTAADSVDQARSAAARGLNTAASAIHDQADRLPGGDRVSGLAHSAADRLSSTADYVRRNDLNSVRGDVEALVKNNPGPALLAAAAVGFLIGRAIARD
jgi:ElaB/YqjD/DUF883 family membrane-anchored ribosome-binding protein